jgi:hypothetical protein
MIAADLAIPRSCRQTIQALLWASQIRAFSKQDTGSWSQIRTKHKKPQNLQHIASLHIVLAQEHRSPLNHL